MNKQVKVYRKSDDAPRGQLLYEVDAEVDVDVYVFMPPDGERDITVIIDQRSARHPAGGALPPPPEPQPEPEKKPFWKKRKKNAPKSTAAKKTTAKKTGARKSTAIAASTKEKGT